jgi:adenine-specific DNA-methyltransferase
MSPRLELVWPGKDKFLLVPKDETGKPVWVEQDHPAAREVRLTDFTNEHGEVNDEDPYKDNLLFTGDSLDVLRVLREVPEYARHYRGKVKLVYIDPPFNTGQTFTHYDDWMEHSTWLSFMRDRLLLIKDLLAADGSVWVHLDDAEVHRMRCLMDEVFGAENFQATVVWQRVDNASSRASSSIVPSHDYILVYSRSTEFIANQESRLEVPAHYDRVDAAGRHYCSRMLRKSGASSRREDRPSMWFAITAPDGTAVWPIKSDGTEGRWQWGPDRVTRDHSQLDWQKNPRGSWEPYLRIYFEDDSTTPHQTWWPYSEVGSNRLSKLEIKTVIPNVTPFPTPKPERLLERVIHIATNPGDIVLDCFGGSGTTAAVAHKMGRRWVTTEVLPDTVATFTAPRMKKVVDGTDTGGVSSSAGWSKGGGFRQVTVAPSMYEITPLGVMLADWATNGRFARAVAGQLGFEWQADNHAPFCGVRGRMRLAVFDGAVGIEEAREVIAALDERERVTIVAKVVLPGVEEFIAEQSRGSRIKKAPRDLLAGRSRRVRKREEGTA